MRQDGSSVQFCVGDWELDKAIIESLAVRRSCENSCEKQNEREVTQHSSLSKFLIFILANFKKNYNLSEKLVNSAPLQVFRRVVYWS